MPKAVYRCPRAMRSASSVSTLNARRFIASSHQPATLEDTARSFSKIRLVRRRNRSVFSGVVFMGVLGADNFRPFNRRRQISHGGRPGHCEDAFILDRELELKPLAPVVWRG